MVCFCRRTVGDTRPDYKDNLRVAGLWAQPETFDEDAKDRTRGRERSPMRAS